MSNILYESSRGIQPISIKDSMLSKREIFFIDDVNAQSSNELLMQLMYLESEDSSKEITIYINSHGGEVTSGLAVYDYISMMNSPVRTVCIGTAASMGAILFLAGSKREMMPHAELMIHDPSYGRGADIAGRKPHEIQHKLDSLNETREMLAQIIAERTGKSLDEIYKLTSEDTFFKAQPAVDFGLATGIVTKTTKTN